MMISVVIPTYNEEKYLEPTIQSVIEQDVPNEIIVVDGGSDDATVEIAEKYADNVIRMERGVSKARNRGAEEANGDVVLFLDADTILHDGCLRALKNEFQSGAVGVCGNIRSGGTLSSRIIYKLVSGIAMMSSFIRVPLFYGMCMAWKRDIFHSNGGFNEKVSIGEDMRLSLDLHNKGPCVWCRDARATTSDRRFRGKEFLRSLYLHLKNFFLIVLHEETNDTYPVVR